MNTKILKIDSREIEDRLIEQAVLYLKSGDVIAFPTDTVYGVGANVFDEQAVNKIFEIKQRPRDKPINVLISSMDQLEQLIEGINPLAERLFRLFWPGALTLILLKKDSVPEVVTAGKYTIGVRMPKNPVALKIIEELGSPLAATSANISGKKSPLNAKEVFEQLGGRIPLILDGGETQERVESTILDLSSKKPKILREGGIPSEKLKRVISDFQRMNL
ncbi:MAG: L-threonylcarbamoyladenylate synthase [Candidatus Heimdallarchaeaceae archaeon]